MKKNITTKSSRSIIKKRKILTLRFTKKKKLRDFIANNFTDEIGNIPNIITFSRLVLIPVIIWLLTKMTPKWTYLSSIAFIFAGFSDFFDGYLARKMNKITIVGKFLDPLADKLTTLSIMVYLSYFHLLPPWLLVIILARELAITGLRTIAAKEGIVIAASQSGKQKTALQFIAITFLLIHYPYRLLGTNAIVDFHRMGLFLLYVSLIFSLFSGIEYFALFMEAVERKSQHRKKLIEEIAETEGMDSREIFLNQDITVFEEHNIEVDLEKNSENNDEMTK